MPKQKKKVVIATKSAKKASITKSPKGKKTLSKAPKKETKPPCQEQFEAADEIELAFAPRRMAPKKIAKSEPTEAKTTQFLKSLKAMKSAHTTFRTLLVDKQRELQEHFVVADSQLFGREGALAQSSPVRHSEAMCRERRQLVELREHFMKIAGATKRVSDVLLRDLVE